MSEHAAYIIVLRSENMLDERESLEALRMYHVERNMTI